MAHNSMNASMKKKGKSNIELFFEGAVEPEAEKMNEDEIIKNHENLWK